MVITTTMGLMDESELKKREDQVDNENECTTSIEYCVLGCAGEAHRTGIPDSASHFCALHVHRSAHVRLKKPAIAFGEAGSFG